jgi:uncharacterized protein YbbC (DUF1343 family)
MKFIPFVAACLLALFFFTCSTTSKTQRTTATAGQILTGADQTEKYLPLLQGKRIAILANPRRSSAVRTWLTA